MILIIFPVDVEEGAAVQSRKFFLRIQMRMCCLISNFFLTDVEEGVAV